MLVDAEGRTPAHVGKRERLASIEVRESIGSAAADHLADRLVGLAPEMRIE